MGAHVQLKKDKISMVDCTRALFQLNVNVLSKMGPNAIDHVQNDSLKILGFKFDLKRTKNSRFSNLKDMTYSKISQKSYHLCES